MADDDPFVPDVDASDANLSEPSKSEKEAADSLSEGLDKASKAVVPDDAGNEAEKAVKEAVNAPNHIPGSPDADPNKIKPSNPDDAATP